MKTVAVMTNDVASSGLQTVLISLYLPSSEPEKVFTPAFMKGFLYGFVNGCREVGCVYISGETPQLKNKIHPGKLDIAGAAFGVVPPYVKSPIGSDRMCAGNVFVFLESSGPHENGFTALRRLAERLPHGYRTKLPSGKEYWEAISAPSILYTPIVQDILRAKIIPTNIEPISGHGWQKLMRPAKNFRYHVMQTLPVSEIFKFVQEKSGMTTKEMISMFNYGAGYAIFVESAKEAAKVVAIARKHKVKAVVAGVVEKSDVREVYVEPWDVRLKGEAFRLKK